MHEILEEVPNQTNFLHIFNDPQKFSLGEFDQNHREYSMRVGMEGSGDGFGGEGKGGVKGWGRGIEVMNWDNTIYE